MKSSDELKFLLTLLGLPDYRAGLSATCFDRFKKGKNQLCQALYDRGWVDCSREIATVTLLPAGRSLLELDTATLPMDADAWKVLKNLASTSGKVAPSTISISKLKAAARQTALESLGNRGFVALEWKIKREKAEVCLTPQGLEYLREDYVPAGKNPTLSLDLLKAYIQFLRKSQAIKPNPAAVSEEVSPRAWSDDEILQAIRELDAELGTENYLPLFHLRQKLGMARQDVDQALYRLQKTDRIELSSLQETDAYTSEQIDAGIPQNVGGPLFFISLN